MKSSLKDEINKIAFTDTKNCTVKSLKCTKMLIPTRGYLKSDDYKIDYTVNPYQGCEHGCLYCFVPKAFSFVFGKNGTKNWGKWVFKKTNYQQVLESEIRRLINRGLWKHAIVRIGSSTDPYQPLEKNEKNTRGILNILSQKPPKHISLQTKSSLIERDFDVFEILRKKITVGISLSTNEEEIRKKYEPKAPSIRKRLEILQKLKEKEIQTIIFISPLLQCHPEKFAEMIEGLGDYYLFKSFRDDGKGGKNLRNFAEQMLRRDFQKVSYESFFKDTVQTFKEELGDKRVLTGRKGFLSVFGIPY